MAYMAKLMKRLTTQSELRDIQDLFVSCFHPARIKDTFPADRIKASGSLRVFFLAWVVFLPEDPGYCNQLLIQAYCCWYSNVSPRLSHICTGLNDLKIKWQ